MKFKVDYVREQFPAFSDASLKRWAHFENAGGSYVAGPVISRMKKYATRNRVQPYYAYPASKAAGEMMDESYVTLAAILNVPEDWVHIGPSTTANAYTLTQAMRGVVNKGENIVVTNQDHEANSGYWRSLKSDGIELKEWAVDSQGQLNTADLWPLIDVKTRFVTFPHVSNIIGQSNPVREITAGLREKNVLSFVDGVSSAPHIWPDVQELGADVYFFSTYKTYGPHQGVMVMRSELAQKLPNQSHYFNADDLRKRYNPAGPDHAQVAGIAGIGEYIESVFVKHFKEKSDLGEMAREVSKLQRKYESKLRAQFFDGLQQLNDLQLIGIGDNENREPTVALFHEEKRGIKLAKQMSKRGVMAAGGDFYAPRVLKAMGIEPDHGVLRLSFVHYNNEKEVAKALKALKKLDD